MLAYIFYFTIKYYLSKKWINRRKEQGRYLGLISEIIQILLIYFIGEKLIINDLDIIGINLNIELLSWILLLLIIFRPVNINFKMFFGRYAPKDLNDETVEGAGSLIGNLERLLVAILMFYGQYNAIGLVFTAKSITRFERISKEPSFAEYYLIGSLYSIISVLIVYGIVIGI